MVRLGQPMFDDVQKTDLVKGMAGEARGWPLTVLRQVSETDDVVAGHGVEAVRNGFNWRFQEGGSGPHVSSFDEFNLSELRGTIDGHVQVELSLGGPHLGQVDVEETDQRGIELLPLGLVAFHVRQAADAVTLRTPMLRRAGELRDSN